MGYAKRHIGSADVMIDETTGALLVKIGDADLSVDVADVDVQAIVDGIAGSSPKTLAELETVLQSILTKLIAAPATEARQDAVAAALGLLALEDGGNLAAILAKLSDDPATETTLAALLDEQEKVTPEHQGASRTPRSHYRIVSDAEEDSSSSGAPGPTLPVVLSEESRPYLQAKVQAVKPYAWSEPEESSSSSSSSSSPSSSSRQSSSSSGEPGYEFTGDALPGSNTGNVYLWAKVDPMNAAWVLTPGAMLELPPNADLNDYAIAAANDGDGVVVLYTEGEPPAGSSSSSSSSM